MKQIMCAINFALIFFACGGSNQIVKDNTDFIEVSEPFSELNEMSLKIIEGGGVAAVGEGISVRRDLAKEKALTKAQGKMAEILNIKIQKMKKTFQEDIGTADNSEVNETFSVVTKSLTSSVLRGAVVQKTKITKNRETGQYLVGVLTAITPKTVNLAVMDALATNNKNVYQRFMASKAHEELKQEMAEYEKELSAANQ